MVSFDVGGEGLFKRVESSCRRICEYKRLHSYNKYFSVEFVTPALRQALDDVKYNNLQTSGE